MCTGLQRKRDLIFAPQRFEVTFESPQIQMFTGLQRKRRLFFTPQSSDDTFALRPGRNACFFCERSPVCSENVDFCSPARGPEVLLPADVHWSAVKRRLKSPNITGLQRERRFFSAARDPEVLLLANVHWSAVKRPLKSPNVTGLQRKRHLFSSSKKAHFFLSL